MHLFEAFLTFLSNNCRANCPKSYISRTIGWDQYPHGRWSDSGNLSYGALTDYQVQMALRDFNMLMVAHLFSSTVDINFFTMCSSCDHVQRTRCLMAVPLKSVEDI